MDTDAVSLSMFGDETPASAAPAEEAPARRDQALYRRYRSRDFAELVGQEPIVRTLKNAISTGRLAHAYLFSGPRGTGKTSMARLLAKAVNCLDPDFDVRPCNKCSSCVAINTGRAVDLIEIDAASNRGVDDVRDLRERVRFAPAELRKKFYIIDEVHMMTTEAFNALLKTLEEPPPHVIFVLATTDPQKLPATVLSRCQRFDFRRFSLVQIVEHLRHICASEGYETEPGVLELIGRQASGGMRDALSLLDQLMSYSDGKLKLEEAERMLGARAAGEIGKFVDTLISRDMPAGLRLLHNALDSGADMRHYNRQLVEYLRSLLLLRAGGDTSLLEATDEEIAALREQAGRVRLQDLVSWTRVFADADQNLRNAVYGALPLELALVQAGMGETQQAAEAPAPVAARPQQSAPPQQPQRPTYNAPQAQPQRPTALNAPETAPRTAPTPIQPAQRPAPQPTQISAVRDNEPAAVTPNRAANGNGAKAAPPPVDAVVAIWPKLVEALNSGGQGRMVAALFRNMEQAWPHHFEGEMLVLGMKFPALQQKIEDMRYKRYIEDQLSALLNIKVLIRAEVMAEETRPKPGRPHLQALPSNSRLRMAAAVFEEDDNEEQPEPPIPEYEGTDNYEGDPD